MQIKIDPEFKALIPQLDGNTKIFGMTNRVGEESWAAEIVPHIQDGYFHVSVFDPSHSVSCTERGVIGNAVELTLKVYGFDFHDVAWKTEPSEKYEHNPYAPQPQTEKPQFNLEGLEKGLENEIVQSLNGNCDTQVHCFAGIADIVTNTSIIEAKYCLDRATLFSAIGQVLIYRQAINPTLMPIVIGYRSSQNIFGIVQAAESMGVQVIFWGEQ